MTKNKRSSKITVIDQNDNHEAMENLYEDVTKFVDKKTLLEYFALVDGSNKSARDDLKNAYHLRLKPLEQCFHYKNSFQQMTDAYIDAKPMILLIGQYSSGKSTFVKYLIDQEYPGIRIGPEPTTDKFVAVMHSDNPGIIPGNALVLDDSKPFKPLEKFGVKFLNRFQASMTNSPVLKGLTIIDTPGVLSDNKSNTNGYDYKAVIQWFAAHADRIFLFVDANKLELSGDFQQIVEMIRVHDDKLRIVLNKTDLVNEQELIRIYGALMWFLSQSLTITEVVQIYIGSFWNKPIANETNRHLFEFEEYRIFEDLSNLPKESLLRKVNCLVKRANEVTLYAYIVKMCKDRINSHLFLKHLAEKKIKKATIKRLKKLYTKIEKQHDLFLSDDFPNLDVMKSTLMSMNLNKVKGDYKKLFNDKDLLLNVDISAIMFKINLEKFKHIFHKNGDDPVELLNPFDYNRGEGFDEGALDRPTSWVVSKYQANYDPIFEQLKNNQNKVTASKAKACMLNSNLPAKVLNKIWSLADIDQDGSLDRDEFALAMHLVQVKLKDYELPPRLPVHLIPLSKR